MYDVKMLRNGKYFLFLIEKFCLLQKEVLSQHSREKVVAKFIDDWRKE